MLTGACTALTLQFVERGVARPPPQAADVTFTLSPPVGRLSSTATCADNVDTLPLSPSTGTLRVYLKTSTAGVVQVQATSVLGVADASVRSKPLVRRGGCRVPAAGPPAPDGGPGASGMRVVCPVSPPV